MYLGFFVLYIFGSFIWIYGTAEANYAYKGVYTGALLVNWVAVFSPFPVIYQDETDLHGRGNYHNYDAHFVPVHSPYHPLGNHYHACEYGQKHHYTELVVFDSSQVLPRYIVELQSCLLDNPNPPHLETYAPIPNILTDAQNNPESVLDDIFAYSKMYTILFFFYYCRLPVYSEEKELWCSDTPISASNYSITEGQPCDIKLVVDLYNR